MPEPTFALEPTAAIGYLGQTVIVELRWEGDKEMLWRCYHIVGAALPVPGVLEHGYFLAMPFDGSEQLPIEIYFDSINTIRVVRDRHAGVRVLDRLPLQPALQGQAHTPEGERRHA